MKKYDYILTFTAHDVAPESEKPINEIAELAEALTHLATETSFKAEWKEIGVQAAPTVLDAERERP